MWFLLLPFGLIPLALLLFLLAGAIALTLFAAGRRIGQWCTTIVLAAPATLLLGAWLAGITAESAPDPRAGKAMHILHPGAVSTLTFLAPSCGFTLFVLIVLWAWRSRDRSSRCCHAVAAALLLTSVLGMAGSVQAAWHTTGSYGVAPAFNASHTREARFVPLDHWIDGMAGRIIWRNTGDFWWHAACETAEELPPNGKLDWPDDHHIRFVVVLDNNDTYTAEERIDGATTPATAP
jgi:hypothetical protein